MRKSYTVTRRIAVLNAINKKMHKINDAGNDMANIENFYFGKEEG